MTTESLLISLENNFIQINNTLCNAVCYLINEQMWFRSVWLNILIQICMEYSLKVIKYSPCPGYAIPCHAYAGIWQALTRQACLSVLSHRPCREGLVQHLHIWMLGKVIQPTKVTNEFLQLLQKLGTSNHKQKGIELDKAFCVNVWQTCDRHGRNAISGMNNSGLCKWAPLQYIVFKSQIPQCKTSNVWLYETKDKKWLNY